MGGMLHSGGPPRGDQKRGTTMRVRVIAGVASVVMGLVWALQGLDVVQGSPMTGQGEWIVLGLALMGLGVTLLVGARRLRDLD